MIAILVAATRKARDQTHNLLSQFFSFSCFLNRRISEPMQNKTVKGLTLGVTTGKEMQKEGKGVHRDKKG